MALRSFPGYDSQCSAQEYPSSAQIPFLWMDLAFLKLPQHLFTPFLNAKRSWGSLSDWHRVLNCLQELSASTGSGPWTGSTNHKWLRSDSSTVSLCCAPECFLGIFQSPGAFLPHTWMCFLALSAAPASSSVTVQPPKPPPVILLP